MKLLTAFFKEIYELKKIKERQMIRMYLKDKLTDIFGAVGVIIYYILGILMNRLFQI